MKFELYMPYDASVDMEFEDMPDYYRDGQEYADTLWEDDRKYKNLTYQAASNGDYSIGNYHDNRQRQAVQRKIAFSKVNCNLYSPNGEKPEDVDSIIDKYAHQKPFLVDARIVSESEDGQFEEEMRQWWKETNNILQYGKQKGGDWIDKNIPKRNLKVSFLNKSQKTVTFYLENAEIEDKISKNEYILFINTMKLIK